jgi:hypothetical protein
MNRSRRHTLATPEPLGRILDRAGESRFARARSPIAFNVWREAVGARIAEKAVPVTLSTGVLLLRVSTSVWAYELSLLADELCARLRDRGVEVRQLRFQVGPLPQADRPAERRPARSVPTAPELPPELQTAIARLSDPALRASVALAATSNLAWQEANCAAPHESVSAALRAVRAPLSSEGGTAPRDQTTTASRGGVPGTREGEQGRSR